MNRKVMLIMDEPLDCTDCPLTDLSSMTGDKLCLASNKRWIETQNLCKKPDWCPLKPMPERKEVHYTHPLFGEVENLTNIGYNKCLDDLGETESDLSTDEGWWRDYELYEMQND